MIRKVEIEDFESILEIYAFYCLHSIYTFDIEPPSIQEFKKQMLGIAEKFPFYVFENESGVVAYAYATDFKKRIAYNKTVEVSIYVKENQHRTGIGYQLFNKFIAELRQEKFHAAIACITLPNLPSVAFHERFGFEKVGHFKEVGFKFNKWIDVGFWELIF